MKTTPALVSLDYLGPSITITCYFYFFLTTTDCTDFIVSFFPIYILLWLICTQLLGLIIIIIAKSYQPCPTKLHWIGKLLQAVTYGGSLAVSEDIFPVSKQESNFHKDTEDGESIPERNFLSNTKARKRKMACISAITEELDYLAACNV